MMYKDIIEHFEKAQSPEGTPWKSLAASTVKSRRKSSSAILQDTGLLRGSNKQQSNKTQAIVSNSVKYGAFHQKGGKKLPQRKFMGISEKKLEFIKQYMLQDIWFSK